MAFVPSRLFPLLGVLVLAHALAVTDVRAQTVHGRVVDGDGAPVGVALVSLVDEGAATVRSRLTERTGEFSLDAAGAGTYQLRVERIGYRTHTTASFPLAEGQRLERSVVLDSQPLELAGIQVETRSRCAVRPEDGSQLATLWEEARKAAEITAAVQAGQRVRLTGVRYGRDLDGSRRQTATRLQRRFSTTRAPFDALPPEELAREGFARREADGSFVYWGPSAAVLVSDPFLEQHCFRRIVDDRDEPGWIGLGFEPVPGAERVGIAGTLWLDRATGELHAVEYEYRDPRGRLPRGGRGRVEFIRLPDGVPIVSRWSIRMPTELGLPLFGGVIGRSRVTAFLEEGGIVLDADGVPLATDDGLLAELEAGL